MFFPYKDDNPQILIPYVTYGILGLNLLIFFYHNLLTGPMAQYAFTLRFGMIPAHFWNGDAAGILTYTRNLMEQQAPGLAWDGLSTVTLLPGLVTLFTAPFLHAGWLHLLGNMLFLYVFADNIEGALGHRKFLLFYILMALAAGATHLLVRPDSMIPVVGASGAISGVLGGYMVRYPRARIHVFVFILFIITTIRLPAYVVLGWWFIVQAANGALSLQSQLGGGTAWFEHIGGFIAGFSFMAIAGRHRKLAG